MVLVDGGVLNPLPIDLVKKQEDAIIVAVNLNGKSDPKFDKKEEQEPDTLDDVHEWFDKVLPDFMKPNSKTKSKAELPPKEESFSLIELMDSTFNFTQDRLTDLMIKIYKPDHLIEIPRNACGVFDFDQGNQIYDIGKESYRKVLGSDLNQN